MANSEPSIIGRVLRHLARFLLSPSNGNANVWGQSMDGSVCKYCGSTMYGEGCPHSPHGKHVHGRRRR